MPKSNWASVLDGDGTIQEDLITLKVDQLHAKDAREERKWVAVSVFGGLELKLAAVA